MSDPKRLRLGNLLLTLECVTPPRLWRVAAVEGEDAAAQLLRPGVVLSEPDLRAAVAGRLDLVKLAARGVRL